ncbi:MAG: type V CRISPR-associated protein Cas12b [Verrucomicrobiaceae bacterium]|nr:type V CRISPR-associated protein Cas12b [Verrucomicrobiaceae bacterium]
MNRIYQGRVTKVEMANPDKKAASDETWLPFHSKIEEAKRLKNDVVPKLLAERRAIRKVVEDKNAIIESAPQEKDKEAALTIFTGSKSVVSLRQELDTPWQAELWRLHVEYQNAVNYYFAAFAAMVPHGCMHRGWREYREAVERCWPYYQGRKGTWEHPFAGVCEKLNISGGSSFSSFREKLFLLTGTQASEGQRFAALVDLFQTVDQAEANMQDEDDSTEDVLKGEAESLFGEGFKMLCAIKTGATDKVTKAGQATKASAAVAKVKSGSHLDWQDVLAFMTKEKTAPWSREEAVDGITKAFAELSVKLVDQRERSSKPETIARVEELLAGCKKIEPELQRVLTDPKHELPVEKPVRVGAGGFDMKSAMLCHLLPSSLELRDVFLHFAKDKAPESVPTEDHCHLARHAGGVERAVFPLYVDLVSNRYHQATNYTVAWEDFEKAAFNEVFVKIGQFRLTGRRFEIRLDKAEKVIAKAESEIKREPNGRLSKIKDLTELLAEGAPDEDGMPQRYSIRERTLKAWPKVRDAWKEALRKANEEAITEKQLVDTKNVLQKRLKEKFGSAALFEELAKTTNRDLWDKVTDKDDPLIEWAVYEDALDERRHLKEPRGFTPAHECLSPRFYRWSATNSKTHLSYDAEAKSTVEARTPFAVDVLVFDFDSLKKRKLRLHYHAPRLLRDAMRKHGDHADGGEADCDWLPPSVKPVLQKYQLEADKQSFAGTSVRLAPSSMTNIQLVFEAEILNKKLSSSWRKKFPFTAYTQKDNNQKPVDAGIRWPRDQDTKKPEWWVDGRVSCLAVDLGINHAAALQVLEAQRLPQAPATGLWHRLAPTPSGGGPSWWVKSISNNLVRLQGEDRWVYRDARQGDQQTVSRAVKEALAGMAADSRAGFLPELSGSAGRNATPAETRDAEKWFSELKEMGDNFHARFPEGAASLAFPFQNDELLFGLSRLRSQLFRLHRWAEHLYGVEHRKIREEHAAKVAERQLRRKEQAREQIKSLGKKDPLHCLADFLENEEQLRDRMEKLTTQYRTKMVELLEKLADRILPSHRGHHQWTKDQDGWYSMALLTDKPRPDVWLAGQRGLSASRLRQLKNLRQMAQSLNHLCRHQFGQRYKTSRDELIPEPFEGCRMALEDAREDRVKQTAHAIFAAALGVDLAVPPANKKQQKHQQSLHGVYVSKRPPVHFIALEQLAPYRTSDKKSRRENRQLAEWRHREIHKVLKDLCEGIGMPIVYVDPSFTSRMSAKDHRIGFRAEEIFKDDPRLARWNDLISSAEEEEEKGENTDLLRVFVQQLEKCPGGKSLLRPRMGGSVFVSLTGDVKNSTFHADLNAAYRIGLRALAHPDQRELFGMINVAPQKEKADKRMIDVSGSLPHSETFDGIRFPVVRVGEHFWEKVNGEWASKRCNSINAARLGKWGIEPPVIWEEASLEDEIP